MKNVKSISVVATIPPLVVCLNSPFCLAGLNVLSLLGGPAAAIVSIPGKNTEHKVQFEPNLERLAERFPVSGVHTYKNS